MSTDQRPQRKQVGVAEMQQIVGELAQLKRDLKKWRSSTESGKPSWSPLCRSLDCGFVRTV